MNEIYAMVYLGAACVLLLEGALAVGLVLWHFGVKMMVLAERKTEENRKNLLRLTGIMLCFFGLWMYAYMVMALGMMRMIAAACVFSGVGGILMAHVYMKTVRACRMENAQKAGEAAPQAVKRAAKQLSPAQEECALVETSYITEALAQRVTDIAAQAKEPLALQFEREWVTITCGAGKRMMAVYADGFDIKRGKELYYAELKTQEARTLLMEKIAAHLAKDPNLYVRPMHSDAAGCVVFGR